jgi:ankyrin repeat protein
VAALCTSPDIDVNQKVKGHAPIHTAARSGYTKAIEILLALDHINVRVTTDYLQMDALHIAAIKGHSEIVDQLMQHRDADPNCQNQTQQTPLHLAAASGRLAVIQSLLRAQNLELHCLDERGKTPIYYAAFGAHWKATDLLLRHSNPINETEAAESSSTNELFAKADVVRRLLEHPEFENPNVTGPGYYQNTLLHRAAEDGDCDVMRALLANKHIDVNVQARFNISPLTRAAKFGQVEAVALLLQHKNIDVNQGVYLGSSWTALTHAKYRKHNKIVDLLLSHGAIDYEVNAPSTAPITAHIDDPQSSALQPDHESQSDPFDGYMDDIPTEAWEEFLDIEEGTTEGSLPSSSVL